jgi:uncharacterized PurR-regulated membrane protein YhhQ (DUF165 family)
MRSISRGAWVALAVYIGAIVGSNWMIAHIGTPIPGAHVLPVGFGLSAPSGVYLAAVAFVARDYVQRLAGARAGLVAIVIGAIVSALVSTPQLAIASGVTFMLSESTDFAIFTPLQRWNLTASVLIAGLFAEFVDSIVFLSLAGIPLGVALEGQLVGKLWVILAGTAVTWYLRRRPSLALPPRIKQLDPS